MPSASQRSTLCKLLVLILVVTGCTALPNSSTQPQRAALHTAYTPTPQTVIRVIINHPKPLVTLDNSIFEHNGCDAAWYDDLLLCSPSGALINVGCDVLKYAPDLLGGLEPKYPIALCMQSAHEITDTHQTHFREPSETEYFYNYFEGSGLRLPLYTRYVIYRNKQFELIRSQTELKQIFAPIDSPNEALAYALALNNWTAYYNLAVEPKNQYFVPILEDTHVERLDDGYIVNLYHYQVLGCGPHWTTLYYIKVSVDGSVQLRDQINAFKDPSEDENCLD